MITYKVNVYSDGDQLWYLNGKLHRTDGPAAIYSDGSQLWYLNGKPQPAPDTRPCVGKKVTVDGVDYFLS